jgi:hypothetical protein
MSNILKISMFLHVKNIERFSFVISYEKHHQPIIFAYDNAPEHI